MKPPTIWNLPIKKLVKLKFSYLLVTLNGIFSFKVFFKDSALGYKIVKKKQWNVTLSFVISKLCSIVLLCHYHCKKKQKGKLQNNIFGYKRVIYFNPRNQNCMLCDLYLCLKSFLAIKSGRESYLIFFYPRPPNCGWSHLLCLFHDHFIKPKADRRIPLLATKRVQRHTRHDFWSTTPTLKLWVVSFAMFDSWPLYQEKSGKT